MRIKIILALFTGIICLNTYIFAADTYQSLLFEGSAPIQIDGDISDWNALSLPVQQLIYDDSNSPEPPSDNTDFNGTFQCCADINYFYASVKITDSIFIFGEERMGKAFHDDSVFFHFPNGRDNISRSTLVVGVDSQGIIKMEYYEHPVDQRYPYIWEALGVKSAYKKVSDGYIVEIAAPHKALNMANLNNTLTAKLNVEVFDDDNGGERDSAFLLDYRGWWYPDWYYSSITFEKTSASVNLSSTQDENTETTDLIVEAVVGSPDLAAGQEIIYSVLAEATSGNWDAAETKLLAAGNFPWVKPMLAWVQLQGNNHDSAISTFSQIADENSDATVNLWAKYFLGYSYMNKRDYSSAKNIYNNLLTTNNFELYENSLNDLAECEKNLNGLKSAISVYDREISLRTPHPLTHLDYGRFLAKNGKMKEAVKVYEEMISTVNDQEYRYHALRELSNLYMLMNDKEKAKNKVKDIIKKKFGQKIDIAQAFERTEEYDEAINIYQSIINLNENQTEVEKARVGIARNFYYKGDFVQAAQSANSIINSEPDSDMAFEAQLIISSIERQQLK